MSWLDLHMHSNISNDGEFSPKQLIEICKKENVKVMSVADHNSIEGVEEAIKYSKDFNIKVIPAIELDCQHKTTDLHVLGYGIDILNDCFKTISKDIENQEQKASLERMKLVKEAGIYFDDEKVMEISINGVVTGEMIAEIAIEDKRNKENPLMSPYYPGGDRSDNPYVNFYWDFCSMGKPAYVKINYISLDKAVEIIKSSGGIPILAHPGNNIKENEEILAEIIDAGVIGVEAYSSYHSSKTTEFYKNMADKYNLIKTVGSDFHGKTKPSIKAGSVYCDNLENEIYENIIKLL